MQSSGNPKMPTLAEAMQEALTPDEAEQFIAYVRPRIERGEGTWRMATAYLWPSNRMSVGSLASSTDLPGRHRPSCCKITKPQF